MTNKSRKVTLITGFLPITTKNKQLFMQNEPNFKNAEMNVSSALSRRYGDFHILGRRKNEPNTNPIRTQTNPIKANLTQFQSKTNPIKPRRQKKKESTGKKHWRIKN